MSGRILVRLSGAALLGGLAVAACGGKSGRSEHGEGHLPSAGTSGSQGGGNSVTTGGAPSAQAGSAESGAGEAWAGAPAQAAGTGSEGGAAAERQPYRVQQVVTGTDHACALLEDQRVKCWGNNLVGQLGLGDTKARGLDPAQMGDALPFVDLGSGRTAKALAAGYRSTCALLDDDTVKCWGNNLFAGKVATPLAIGDEPGEMGDALPVIDLPKDALPYDLAVGHFGACILFGEGSYWCGSRSAAPGPIPAPTDASCSGMTGSGNVLALCSDHSARALVAGSKSPALVASNVRLMAASVHYYCFAFTDGTATCTGDHGFDVPQAVDEFRSLAVTVDGVLCGLRGGGEVVCWGNLPPSVSPSAPVGPYFVPISRSVVHLSGGGDDYNCGTLADGTVECWNWGPVPLAAVGNSTFGSAALLPVELGTQELKLP